MKDRKLLLPRIQVPIYALVIIWGLVLVVYYLVKIRSVGRDFYDFVFLVFTGLAAHYLSGAPSPGRRGRLDRSEDLSAVSDLIYHAIVETSPDSVLVTDLKGKILFCSKQTARLHQYDGPDELSGLRIYQFLSSQDLLSNPFLSLLPIRYGYFASRKGFPTVFKDGLVPSW